MDHSSEKTTQPTTTESSTPIKEDVIVFEESASDTENFCKTATPEDSEETDELTIKEQYDSSRRRFFSRLFNKKIKRETPEITKGVKIENLHSNFHRKKTFEGKPEDFPKKVKIISWQDEQKLGLDGQSLDLDLQDELAALAREVNAKK